ncbi:MAG: PD-(D/E)XK nuclease family protein [Chloroflexi bacterium]|nr:PD-(D/E)XK nuclease family protein [Chloroflexota bacterium]
MTEKRRVVATQEENPFGVPLQELLAGVTWSYSRRSTLGQCTRRYYYEYFGANKRAAKQEPLKESLHFLKGLQNRHERTGTIAHLVIAAFLRKAQAGEMWNVDRLVSWARDIFKTDTGYSRAHPDGDVPPSGKYPPVLLHEYHYHYPDANDLCREAETRMVEAIRSFARDSRFSEFREAGSAPRALVGSTRQSTGYYGRAKYQLIHVSTWWNCTRTP